MLTEKLEGKVSVGFREIGLRGAEIIDWRARLVAEAHLPHRELGSDSAFEMRFLLRSELRRRESPVVA